MTIYIAILIGLKEVWTHKFRSILTMLGIVLGVASLVAMAAIVKGMENGMKEAMIALGGLDKALTREAPVPTWQSHLADQAPGSTTQRQRTTSSWKLYQGLVEMAGLIGQYGSESISM